MERVTHADFVMVALDKEGNPMSAGRTLAADHILSQNPDSDSICSTTSIHRPEGS